jgi:glucan phosphoethanolaminetransferase (alkaline phosphatase superfamily)
MKKDMKTSTIKFYELCEEIDKWREEAEYWKSEAERISKEYHSKINADYDNTMKQTAKILSALINTETKRHETKE